jgi:small subunit ribosomal protein S4e
MARKGNKRHLKSLNAPGYFGIRKKSTKYVLKPNAGRHALDRCITVALFAKRLGIAGTTNDAKRLVNRKEILVNNKAVSDIRYPIGLNDVITIKSISESYVLGISGVAKVTLQKMSKETNERTCRIIKKYRAKGGKLMFGLHDGTIIEGNDNGIVNDSVNIDMDNKIKKMLKLDKDSRCLVVDGVHVGTSGIIKEIKQGTVHSSKSVVVQGDNGSSFETLVKNIMVVS